MLLIIAKYALFALCGWIADFLLKKWKKQSVKTKGRRDDILALLIHKAAMFGLIAIIGINILSDIGFDVRSIIAGLGMGGLVVAFAFQSLLKNTFSGIMLFVSAPFQPGDHISVLRHEGIVEDISFNTITLRTDTSRVVIPSAKILASPVEIRTPK